MLNLLRGKSSASVGPSPKGPMVPSSTQSRDASRTQSRDSRRWTQFLRIPLMRRDSTEDIYSSGVGMPITIYFGSQSGRTEALANRLHHGALRRGLIPIKKDLYKFDPEEFFNETTIIFVLATFTGGGPTDNAAHFNFWLQHQCDTKALKKSKALKNVRYCVFVCGDTKYGVQFNAFGMYVDEKLFELGAKRLMTCCLGDTNAGLEGIYHSWEEDIFRMLTSSSSSQSPLTMSEGTTTGTIKLPKGYELLFRCIDVSPSRAPDILKRRKDTYNPMPATSIFFEKPNLTFESVVYTLSEPKPAMMHIDLLMELPPFVYSSADTIGIYPRNPLPLVKAVASLLEFPLTDRWIQLIPIPGSIDLQVPFPSPAPLTLILAQFYELATVSPAFLSNLATYATNTEETAKLLQLSTDTSSFDATIRGMTLAGVLRQYPSIRMDLNAFLHVAPPLRQHQYTIASSNYLTPTHINICVSVPPALTFQNTDRSEGMVGAFFMELSAMKKAPSTAEERVPRPFIRSILIPSKIRSGRPNETITLVAIGSGFAVVRAIMLDRLAMASTVKHSIIYGCSTKDCVPYQNELKLWQSKLDINLVLACSSEKKDDIDINYAHVQDAVQDQAESIIKGLDGNQGRMIVCGKVSMANDVKQILCLVKEQQLRAINVDPCQLSSQIDEWIQNLIICGRYVESAWG